MFKLLIPIILIGVAVTGYFLFGQPIYGEISALKVQTASYDEALNNSKVLEAERERLTKKFNVISAANLERLAKLLPNNVDNIRLILEIEKVAGPFGMVLKDIKYNVVETEPETESGAKTIYGSWDLEFSTQGTYTNFLNFVKALESNLRIVDISSVEFQSTAGTAGGAAPATSGVYKYNFKIKTYWLKN